MHSKFHFRDPLGGFAETVSNYPVNTADVLKNVLRVRKLLFELNK